MIEHKRSFYRPVTYPMCWSVCVCVCRSVWKVCCSKTVDWIQMPFVVVSGVSWWMSVLDGMVIIDGNGQFWGEFGASHFNHWGLSCIVVQKCMNGSFGLLSGVGRGIDVLDEVHISYKFQGKFQRFSPHWFEWHIFKQKCFWLVCGGWQYFRTNDMSLEMSVLWLSEHIVSRLKKFAKCNRRFHEKNHAS